MIISTHLDSKEIQNRLLYNSNLINESNNITVDDVIKSTLYGQKLFEVSIKEINIDEYSIYKNKVKEFRNNRSEWIRDNFTSQYISMQNFSYFSHLVLKSNLMKYYFFFRVNNTFNTDSSKSNLELLKENISENGKKITICETEDTIVDDYDIVISYGKRKNNKLRLGTIFMKDKNDYLFIKLSQDIKCSRIYEYGEINVGN